VPEPVTLYAGVFQIAYLVPNLETAMSEWSRRTGAGPWFIMRNLVGIKQQVGGVEDNTPSTIALAQAGATQIELIEINERSPAFYRDHVAAHGFGLHHLGLLTADFDRDKSVREARGEPAIFTAQTPSGGRVAHMLDPDAMPHVIELIELDTGTEAFFAAIIDASRHWDGTQPHREVSNGSNGSAQ
jgi:hypothetical protein